MKKVIALIAALMVVIRFLVFQCFAVGAAPVYVAGEELAGFLAGALGAAGHDKYEIDRLTIPDQLDLLGNDLKNGNISLDTPVTYETNIDGINQAISYPLEVHLGLSKDIPFYNPPVFALNWYAEAVKDFMSDYNVLSNSDYYFIPTKIDNSTGSGSVLSRYGDLNYENFLSLSSGDYIIVDYDELGRKRAAVYVGDTRTTVYSYLDAEFIQLQGDVRYFDGTYDPDKSDIYEYQIGEVDGTKVTVDMLNPDGTVTIDSVTYYPVDYLDPDKLTEEGKDKLIYDITNIFNNA